MSEIIGYAITTGAVGVSFSMGFCFVCVVVVAIVIKDGGVG